MQTIHIVSHTHWDREWYLTYQQFRIKLVHLMDNLLELLNHDPDFKHFMLDGQTIILDDYLQVRPEREAEIRAHIQSGRLVIGPWHILADEFLVSPESTIRNLLQGERTASKFGPKTKVGYLPDTFGHIGQMPQILRGFGIDIACVWRGLSNEPCELWWQAPDGSRVLMNYLRDSYSNAASLAPDEPQRFAADVNRFVDSIRPYSDTNHLLLMFGTDHMEPPIATSAGIAYANQVLSDKEVLHSTLPAYLEAVKNQLSANHHQLPIIIGELRACQRSPLLPGVLSTRMWIKQRNQTCETLLEQWAEPFSTWASLIADDMTKTVGEKLPSSVHPSSFILHPSSLFHHAWQLLMECHPHDSICGCSIDQVHTEMHARFDQAEQIGEEITRQSLESIASAVYTINEKIANSQFTIIVFNPTSVPQTDLIHAEIQLPFEITDFEIVDENGNAIPCQSQGLGSRELINVIMDPKTFREGTQMVHDGRIAGMAIRGLSIERDATQAQIEILLSESGEPDRNVWQNGTRAIEALLADPSLRRFLVRARSLPENQVEFVGRDIPPHGYRSFWVRGVPSVSTNSSKPVSLNPLAQALLPLAGAVARSSFAQKMISRRSSSKPPFHIENDFFLVEASPKNGTLTITDRRSGAIFTGLNQFVDGGDCGDEYNFCPPEHDRQVQDTHLRHISIKHGKVQQTLEMHLELRVPRSLTPDRCARTSETVKLSIVTLVSLAAGIPRIDIHTRVMNGGFNPNGDLSHPALDHRLRVYFPAPFTVSNADYDGHFEVITRPVGVPAYDDTWVEQPRPEQPQRAFTCISNGQIGLLIANRGLPEVEVLPAGDHSVIALTLLRCVGWLSRDDFATRKGHAGPMALATPGAQLPGEHTFDYAIIPFNTPEAPYSQAHAFNAPLRAVSAPIQAGSLPNQISLVSISIAPISSPIRLTFPLSAIKTAERGSGWIVRGYNIGAENINVTLTPWRRFNNAELVNLAEETLALLEPSTDGSVTFRASGHEIITIKFSD